ncbi:addiction module protein [Marinicella gelatinilytica]|uniref:addiction module protein n=1 Tax=Marinicella gelatinilytica TaxID=2996017 RepID=UPI002260D309|nr:addiction module protein [Marinicella gelatinilytica]MCX7545270.1 addiction module protein [Marinicella gelatinilytica]
MKPELHIDKMTVSEKLDTMERLWDSLTNLPEEFPSPLWHKTILEKRHKDAQKNPNKFLDFEEAKKLINKAIQ